MVRLLCPSGKITVLEKSLITCACMYTCMYSCVYYEDISIAVLKTLSDKMIYYQISSLGTSINTNITPLVIWLIISYCSKKVNIFYKHFMKTASFVKLYIRLEIHICLKISTH